MPDNIDQRALERNQASQMREDKNSGTTEPNEADESSRSLRQEVMEQRLAQNVAERSQEIETQQNPKKINTRGAKLTRSAWANTLDSFGLTLIWPNIVWFMSSIPGLRGMIHPLGAEWLPPGIDPNLVESKVRNLGFLEKMGLAFVDILVLFIILMAIMVVVLILNFSWSDFFDLIWDTVKDTVVKN
ncbi:MAG: hypothetical protein WCK11_04040 [Candidatus Falkowbacteria bacterium]